MDVVDKYLVSALDCLFLDSHLRNRPSSSRFVTYLAVADLLIPACVPHQDALQLGLIDGAAAEAGAGPVQILNDLIGQLLVVRLPLFA